MIKSIYSRISIVRRISTCQLYVLTAAYFADTHNKNDQKQPYTGQNLRKISNCPMVDRVLPDGVFQGDFRWVRGACCFFLDDIEHVVNQPSAFAQVFVKRHFVHVALDAYR